MGIVRRSSGRVARVEGLESRRLFAAAVVGVYPFGGSGTLSLEDGDGTVVKFGLVGGQGTVTVGEEGWQVAVKKPGAGVLAISGSGGDGRVNLASITGKGAEVKVTGGMMTGAVAVSSVKAITVGAAVDWSVTSAGPLVGVTANSWVDGDGVADVLSAPSIGTLAVKGSFGAGLALSSKKVALSSATVGGTVSGVWAVAGSVGTLKLHAVRSTDLTISGNVGSVGLDDFVAVSQVQSATGGVIHIGGKGAVSAGKGQDKFQVAKNTTLYTCTADMYTWSELYQYDHLGRSWTYTDNGTKEVSAVRATTESSRGHDLYLIDDSGPDGGTESYYRGTDGRGHAVEFRQGNEGFRFSDLVISPTVYRFGQTMTSTSKVSMSMSEDGVTANMSGVANFSTRFAGHQLVTTPAGTFLTVRLVSSLGVSAAGAISNGEQSLGIRASVSEGVTEYAVPGRGLVKYDDASKSKFSAPSANESETDHASDHVVLVKGPRDTFET